MPQGKKKTPFSGKAKKQQLQAKKQMKKFGDAGSGDDNTSGMSTRVKKINVQPSKGRGDHNTNRYNLHFRQETNEEVQQEKERACMGIVPVPDSTLEASIVTYYPEGIDFPKRPPWNFTESKAALEAKEQRYFREYLSGLESKFGLNQLSHFELNLETWRQLWRVLEMSDIVLFIVDIRYPVAMFPPDLYDYVTRVMEKDMILIMNKIDLAPAPLVVAWREYLQSQFPSLIILVFTSCPGYNLRGSTNTAKGLQVRRRRGKLRMAAEGAKKLLEACDSVVHGSVDLSSWHKKIAEEMESEYDDVDEPHVEVGDTIEVPKSDTSYVEHKKYADNILTIGCVGQPNVGKSSLMNSVMGKKVVSVSRTPGHTKYFQTIFLTPNVRLCDCPGLVFPSKVPKTLQVLLGCYPIAQLRIPYSVVGFLAERLDLPKLLNIKHPEGDDEWSAMDICEGWAIQRGFYTARAARPDVYRAANHILRMALDGKVCLCLRPPGFSEKKDEWEKHKAVEEIKWIQAQNTDSLHAIEPEVISSDDDDEQQTSAGARGTHDPSGDEEAEAEEEDESDGSNEDVIGVENKFSALLTED